MSKNITKSLQQKLTGIHIVGIIILRWVCRFVHTKSSWWDHAHAIQLLKRRKIVDVVSIAAAIAIVIAPISWKKDEKCNLISDIVIDDKKRRFFPHHRARRPHWGKDSLRLGPLSSWKVHLNFCCCLSYPLRKCKCRRLHCFLRGDVEIVK